MEKILNERVTEEVVKDLAARLIHGYEKYKVTLDREDLTHRQWLQHAYEEALDLAKYLKRAILQIDDGKNNISP
jgi:hypothetical protein